MTTFLELTESVPLADWSQTAGKTAVLANGILLDTTDRYLWLVIIGGLVAFFMAWGIGANDVANSFATSVGAGSISLMWACVVAGVMEFLGAFLLGSKVTDTVRKKVINVSLFDPNAIGDDVGALNGPEVLMTGFLCALVAASLWLLLATALSLPVSTTHSIIGSLIGVGLVYGGGNAVEWLPGTSGDGLKRLKGVVGVIVSWFLSPVLSGVFSVVLFLIVRHLVLRRKNSVRNGFLFAPVFYGFAVTIVLFFIIYKGSPGLDLDEKFSVGEALGISFGGGAGAAVFTWFIINPMLRKSLERWQLRQAKDYVGEKGGMEKAAHALKKLGVNVEITEQLSDEVLSMHDKSEKFCPKTEYLFTWVQVFTAAFDSFAHGANDVANSIGPFASVYSLYTSKGVISTPTVGSFDDDVTLENGVSVAKGDPIPDGESFCGFVGNVPYMRCRTPTRFPWTSPAGDPTETPVAFDLFDGEGKLLETGAECYQSCAPGNAAKYSGAKQGVELWILALGGIGIVLGLAMWGYRIIIAIGSKLTKLTPSRGFAIELGASIAVLIASRQGLPVSTTHCQVGATVGVGLVELKFDTVNWKQFGAIFVGWIFTLIFTGLLAAALFAFAVFSPTRFVAGKPLNHCPSQQSFVVSTSATENIFQGIACAGLTPSASSVADGWLDEF